MTTKREKILQKLNPKFLKMTPRLSGDVGSFIDLDSDGCLVAGAKDLMIRFFKNQDLCEKNKRLTAQNETELTISTAKYNKNNEICELITERLTLPLKNIDEDVASEKPGRRLQELKMELQEKMSAKWEEEYKKRVNENIIYSEPKHKSKKKYVEDDADDENEDEDEDEDKDVDKDDLKDPRQGKTSQSKDEEEESEDDNSDDGGEADIEFDDDDDDGHEENSDSDVASVTNDENNPGSNLEKDDDYENCSLIPAYQPGGGMLYGGSELTQGDDALPQNLFSPTLKLSINESSGSKISEFHTENEATPKKAESSLPEGSGNIFTAKAKLFSQNPNDLYDLNDAFELCSGKFPDPEDKSVETESQNLVKGNVDDDEDDNDNEDDDDDDNDDDDDDDDDGSDDKKDNKAELPEVELKSRKFQNIVVFDDSEEENEEVTREPEEITESQSAPLKILSDDEDEIKEGKKTKKRRKNLHFSDEDEDSVSNFKDEENDEEKENEVSDGELEEDGDDQRSIHYDSEENEINPREFFEKEAELSGSEWSGDEDERGMDEFDVEEGDADYLDQDQVRSQLEKIHIRRVLDDDAREVRLIQEILFEDGDLHSDGKRRDRKFKWKNLGAFEEDNEVCPKEEGENDSEDDGAEDEQLRKLRHEKELFLMTKKKNGDLSSDDEIVEDFHSVKVTTVKTSLKLPVENSRNVTSITEIANGTSFSSTRGSFLTRNEEFLSRLAKVTSVATDNVLGPKNSKNFVFATKSPEKGDSERNVIGKRQIEDAEPCSRREKKTKFLPPEVDTGPSILDLLV